MDARDELIGIFRAEVGEDVEKLVAGLASAAGSWDVAGMMRLTHKIRGAARAVEETSIHDAASAIEELLSGLRAGRTLDEECLLAARLGGSILEACCAVSAGGAPPDVHAYRARVATLLQQGEFTAAVPAADALSGEARAADASLSGMSTIRVSVERLERTMGAGAELGVHLTINNDYLKQAQELLNGFVQRTRSDGDSRLELLREQATSLLAHLDVHRRQTRRLLGHFEQQMQRLRMVPLANVRALLSKVCRDACRETGKRASLDMSGARSWIDRELLEKLRDVLIHLVRNAIAHGIESAEQRRERGKPPVGRIVLSTTTQASWLEIRVEDDGAGIDADAVVRRALDMGLVTAAEVDLLDEKQKLELIYTPGLSTARQTELAGRGVGLDVVHSEIARVGGRISLESTPGKGTTFRIQLPLVRLTLSCIRARLGESTVAIPTNEVSRVMQVAPESLEQIEGVRVLRAKTGLVPVHELGAIVGLPADGSGSRPALLIERDSQHAALLVDAVLGQREITVQPLPWNLRGLSGVTGCCSLGFEGLVLVLDTAELARRAREARQPLPPAEKSPALRKLLVADDSITSRTLLAGLLRKAGYQVHAVENGAHAWRMLNEQGFDLLVSDMEMPELDGLALTRRIRGDERLRALPVVLVTSLGSEQERRNGAQAGADSYVVKSEFDQDRLLATISRLLGSP